jgi:trk system potassium uptake protein TrkH
MSSLIILGGLGFVVLLELPKLRFWPKKRVKLSLQTKIVLTTTIFLIVIGSVVFIILENANSLSNLSVGEKIMNASFQSITSRTAGFSTVTIEKLATPTLFVIISLMFIGASPGSTGGGIKTSTFCIMLATLRAMMKNRNEVALFGRTLPRQVTRKAIIIFILSLAWIFTLTLLLSIAEEGRPFINILFEVTSAFGTVGLSTGITPTLSSLGKILIALTMFVGRIGPLTLALAVALREERAVYKYPEERVMVG